MKNYDINNYENSYVSNLSQDELQKYFIKYLNLLEETKYYKETLIESHTNFWFAPLLACASTCIGVCAIDKSISFFTLIFCCIFSLLTSSFFIGIVKSILLYEYMNCKKKNIPAYIYIIIAIAIPIISYIVLCKN